MKVTVPRTLPPRVAALTDAYSLRSMAVNVPGPCNLAEYTPCDSPIVTSCFVTSCQTWCFAVGAVGMMLAEYK